MNHKDSEEYDRKCRRLGAKRYYHDKGCRYYRYINVTLVEQKLEHPGPSTNPLLPHENLKVTVFAPFPVCYIVSYYTFFTHLRWVV